MIRATDNGGDDAAAYHRTLTQFANLYAEQLGWKLVALHGYDGTKCTCQAYRDREGLGACPSPGKHPVLRQWDATASSDPSVIIPRLEQHSMGNLGVLLGPQSGIIDIEFDSDEGRATAEQLFADIVTPTYESARSRHYLFKWSARLPMIQKLEPKSGLLAGLEIRIGNGDKATQSVLPPSRHHSGAVYHWLDGMTPGLVDVAPLPRDILGAIINYDPGSDKVGSGKGLDAIKQETVSEGGRNDTLFKFACLLAGQSRNIAAFSEQQFILQVVECVNVAKCRPPLPEHEVKTLVESAIFTERSGQARRGEQEGTPPGEMPPEAKPVTFEAMGIDYDDAFNTYHPGNWRLEIVQADPMFYRLIIPAFCKQTAKGDGAIEVPGNMIDRAGDVARLIRQGTGGHAVVNPFPGEWETIWKGRKKGKKDAGCEGLFSQLINAAKVVDGSVYNKRWVVVAEFLLGKMFGAYRANQKELPGGKVVEQMHDANSPTKFSDGTVYFKWQTVFLDGLNAKQFTEEDVKKLRQKLEMDHSDKQKVVKLEDGSTARVAVMTDEDISRLQSLIYHDSTQENTPF